jgi:alanyl-tRNA synthetase
MQKGSLVAPDRLRFDFTHDSPLSRAEIERIEDLVNAWIEENAPRTTRLMAYDEAVRAGAIAIFDEKYGDEVRVVAFGARSTELCGGTHADAAGDIGLLKIVAETGIAAGVRRIEAQTGLGALALIREQEALARSAAELLKVPLGDLPSRVEKLLAERRDLERELEQLRSAKRGSAVGDLLADAAEIDGAKILGVRVADVDAKDMRQMVDELRNRLGTSAVLLVSESAGKVLLAVGVTPDLTDRFKAGDLIREIAGIVGGGGGGRPDFAQAGGRDPSQIDAALQRFREICGAA